MLFTARDTVSNLSDAKTAQVTVLPVSAAIKLKPLPEVSFAAGSTGSLRLNGYVETGDTTRISWRARVASGQNTVTVSIDPATRVVTLGNAPGFTGTETVVFTASDGNSSAEASAQVTVTPATAVGDLKLVVIANPIQRAFVDVFVASKRDLASEPTVIVELAGERSLVPLKNIKTDLAGTIWNGNLTLRIGQVGDGRILASAVTNPWTAVSRRRVWGPSRPSPAPGRHGPGGERPRSR